LERLGPIVRRCLKERELREGIERAEQALQVSVSRYQALLDNSPAVAFLKDTYRRYILVNRQFETCFDLDKTAVVGKQDDELFGRDEANRSIVIDREVLATGQPQEMEATSADGERAFLICKFPVRDSGGQITGLGGVGLDITN